MPNETAKNSYKITIEDDDITYSYHIDAIDDATIFWARQMFERFTARGIIEGESFDANKWMLSNEVLKRCANFECDIDDETAELLGCSDVYLRVSLRAYLVMRIAGGTPLAGVIDALRVIKKYLIGGQFPNNVNNSLLLEEYLLLLVGEPASKLSIVDSLSIHRDTLEQKSRNKRQMANYQSYIMFDHILKKYWETAGNEKYAYFAVWFWWSISGIIPLRPTCIVLTPRLCLRELNGKYYLTLRRTKLKKKIRSKYFIPEDYEECEYRITEEQYREIAKYIEITSKTYKSDIDTLFSKSNQFDSLGRKNPNDNHYTYKNLCQCLKAFYENIIIGQYGYRVVEKTVAVLPGEIEKITLGDTRVFSLISLFLTGNSAVVCKELAGHDTIEMSNHYYSNISSFLDALSCSLYRSEDVRFYRYQGRGLIGPNDIPVEGGYCKSENAKVNKYLDCMSAVDKQGQIGKCFVCEQFVPSADVCTKLCIESKEDMEREFRLMREEINAIRKGIGATETLEAELKRFRSDASQYILRSIQKQALTEDSYE